MGGYPIGMDADEATDPGSASDQPGAERPVGRCLMCDRWIEAERLAECPEEVLCIDHRDELTRLRDVRRSAVGA